MSDGFAVDLTALDHAANGIITTMDEMATTNVAAIPDGVDVGHDALSDTLGAFCRRWDIGVTNLEKDVDTVATKLRDCCTSYRQTDEAKAAGYAGVISRAAGADPGVG